ncbi:ran-binding protein 3 isoform X1 [Leptopilina heterotoma]|uniref:ran-binding protein 3 isoform X1 n=1 Tax=Leptopilina heterotoma TaxID=63436 RepID=UPI001CA8A55D|nr:ran-binding protein 3 isoform X1 [Leptopilina heterotoma]
MADCKDSNEKTNGPEPVINMKYDTPEESSENSANEEVESQSTDNDSEAPLPSRNQISNKRLIKGNILASSKLGSSFASCDYVKAKSSLLRPSQLNSVANNPGPSTKLVLQPAKFHNPFAKLTNDNVIEGETETPTENNACNEKNESKEKQLMDVKPTFLPLGASSKENENSLNNTVAPSSSAPSFVFGQNIKERVTVVTDGETSDQSANEEMKEETNENGSSELLFSNVTAVTRSTSRPGLTLTQAAQELEEATRANKRKYNEVALLTGEEGETNVLQINCKLFAFDKVSSSYKERGRGTLRLNDRDDESRLVSRTAGTQRLILNTKIWPGMTAERAGPKSLRLTAMDIHGDLRIFIVQASPKEIDLLEDHLTQRLKRAKERQPKRQATNQ